MAISENFQKLFDDFALVNQSAPLTPDHNGHFKVRIRNEYEVVLIPNKRNELTVMMGVMPLPTNLDYACYLWLLRKNFHDSSLHPLRVSCDLNGSIVIGGNIPLEQITGESLAGILNLLESEADSMREELQLE